MQIAEEVATDNNAIRANTRRFLQWGYTKDDAGKLCTRPLKGRNGVQKLLTSPLVRALGHTYPKRIRIKVLTLLHLSQSQWDRYELALQAIGLTILVNPLLSKDYWKDEELLKKWDQFKLFWINWSLLNCYVEKGSDGKYHSVIPNLTRALSGLKNLSAWAGWYANFNEESSRPKIYSDMLDSNLESNLQPLCWFGGCLSELREPGSVPSHRICHALAQVRSFGRALPPAFGPLLTETGTECIKVLTQRFDTPEEILELYRDAAVGLGASMPKAQKRTHVSVSKTSSFLVKSEVGGKAAELCPLTLACIKTVGRALSNYDFRRNLWEIATPEEAGKRVLYDCFGRVLLRLKIVGEMPRLPSGIRPPDIQLIFGSKECRVPQLILKSILALSIRERFHEVTVDMYTMALWPDMYPMDTIIAPLSSEPWLNNLLSMFVEQTCISDLRARDVVDFEPFHAGALGRMNYNGVGMRSCLSFFLDRTPVVLKVIGELPCGFRVLGEPGLKGRPLTIGLASANCIMQEARFMIEPSFHADPRCRIGFEEIHVLWSFNKVLGKLMKNAGIKHPRFINSDFKAATDYLPLDLIEAMWSGWLEGQNLPKRHPLWVVMPLMFARRRIFPADNTAHEISRTLGQDSWLQERGSFMGEPMSFLTLTLYNLLTVSLAGMLMKCKPFDILDAVADPSLLKISAVPCQVVGDDLMAVVDRDCHFPYFHKELVRHTGMKFSPGKDSESEHYGILCEDMIYYGPNADNSAIVIEFLDIIKCRLLTRMTRVHSDNRSAVIGKGAQVQGSIEWNPFPMVRKMARLCYLDTFSETLLAKKFLGKSFPFELSNNVGGISLPGRQWDEFSEDCSFVLRFLWWVLKLELPEFIAWHLQLSRIASRRKRGVPIEHKPEDFSKVFSGFRYADPTESLDTPQRVFPRYRILEGLRELGVEIPHSPFTGQPVNSVLSQEAENRLKMVTIAKLIEYSDRIMSFAQLFKNPEKPSEPLSFAKYQRESHRFWKGYIGKLETKGWFSANGTPLPETHGFKGFDDIRRQFAIKCQNYVSIEHNDFWFMRFGPTLQLRFD